MKRAVVVVSLVAAILLFAWWAPPLAFNLAVMAAAVLATRELYAMFGVAGGDRFLWTIGLIATAALTLLPATTLIVAIPFLVMSILAATAFRTKRPQTSELMIALIVIFGIIYMPLTLGQAICLRAAHHGRELIMIVVAAVFTREISAHFAGKLFHSGKPLNGYVNEHKSYTGAAISAVVAAGVVLWLSWRLNAGFTTMQALAFGLCLGVACQLGDFAESYLNRVSGVRHSGTILGPEGGVLDFLDAAAFAILAARLFLFVIEK